MNTRTSDNEPGDSTAELTAKAGAAQAQWRFVLYIAGQSPKSMTAIGNVRRLCEEYLPGNYEIETVDLMVQPELAQRDQILAVPTLVRRLPEPVKRIIGDLSDYERTLMNLGLPGRPDTA